MRKTWKMLKAKTGKLKKYKSAFSNQKNIHMRKKRVRKKLTKNERCGNVDGTQYSGTAENILKE